ncbi:MAG: metal-sensitive transcriptional regulator [Opitutales bacterium]|nr:metal-sensitive transcriptional regulator [Opitutales bacterium]
MKKSPKNEKHSHCRTEEEKKKLVLRLRRIEGQVRGIAKMLEADQPCIEILRQISSISGALHGVWTSVVADHLKGCIKDALKKQDESLVNELVEHLKKVR